MSYVRWVTSNKVELKASRLSLKAFVLLPSKLAIYLVISTLVRKMSSLINNMKPSRDPTEGKNYS